MVMKWDVTPYNLYIKLPDGRFLTLLRIGNRVDPARLLKYAAKGVTTLFASEQDLAEAVGPEAAMIQDRAKMKALEKVSDAVFDELKLLGLTEASFNHAKTVGKAVRGLIEREPQLSSALAKFQDLCREDVRHSVMVSAISTIIISSMDWIKPATQENVAMGGLLHDLGKLTLPPELISVDINTLGPNDRKIVEGHAEAGRALLSQVKTVPEDIAMIVAHHHERSDGSGYPLGIKDIYIHPLSRVVGLGNEIVERYEADREAGRKTCSMETLSRSSSTAKKSKLKIRTRIAQMRSANIDSGAA
jgi:putative nucleotidyltransferase with HDIG domain